MANPLTQACVAELLLRARALTPCLALQSESFERANCDGAAPTRARKAFGEFGGVIDRLGLDHRVAADNLLGFDERPVRDDFLAIDDAPFLLQPVAAVDHPTFLKPLTHPGMPFLHVLLHFFGR